MAAKEVLEITKVISKMCRPKVTGLKQIKSEANI